MNHARLSLVSIGSDLLLVCVLVALALDASCELSVECCLMDYLSTTCILRVDVLLRTTTRLLVVKFKDVINTIANSFFIVGAALRHGGDGVAAKNSAADSAVIDATRRSCKLERIRSCE